MLRLHLLGAFLALISLALGTLGPLAEAVPRMLALYAIALVPLCVVAARAQLPGPAVGGSGPASPARLLGVVMLWAVLVRLPLLAVEPSLSDDHNRYTWEGRVVLAGEDPYDLSPQSSELAALAAIAPERSKVNHPHLPALYPPGAQWMFAGIVAISDSQQLMRVVFTCLDLVVILVLWLLMRSSRAPPQLLILYAWHPLPAIEVANSGHFEPMAIVPMLLGLWIWRSGPRMLAWPLWGLALATKFVGGLPALFAIAGQIRERKLTLLLQGVALLLLVPMALALPFCLDGTLPLGSLGHFARNWGNFAAFHSLAAAVIGYHPARVMCGLALLLWGLWLARGDLEPARGFLLFFAGMLLLSPVVHPWYGLWLLVLMPLYPSLPLFLLSSLLPVSYLSWTVQQQGGEWLAPAWAPWLAYGLPVALLLWRRWWAGRA